MSSETSNVGITSITISIYCVILAIMQFLLSKRAGKAVVIISLTSIIIMAFAPLFISFTYYFPYLWTIDECYCHQFWSASLICYIASIHFAKAMYVYRVHVISRDSVLDTPQTRAGIKMALVSLMTTMTYCFISMIVLTGGECHSDPETHGCIATFHIADLYLALIMLSYDAVLYIGFCYKWYKSIEVFRMSGDREMSTHLTRGFYINCMLTMIAITSCFIDAIIHLLIHNDGYNYHTTMIVYLIDCAIVATCHFCRIRECQEMIEKYICICCCCTRSILMTIRRNHVHVDNKKTLERVETNSNTKAKEMKNAKECDTKIDFDPVKKESMDTMTSDRPTLSIVPTKSNDRLSAENQNDIGEGSD